MNPSFLFWTGNPIAASSSHTTPKVENGQLVEARKDDVNTPRSAANSGSFSVRSASNSEAPDYPDLKRYAPLWSASADAGQGLL